MRRKVRYLAGGGVGRKTHRRPGSRGTGNGNGNTDAAREWARKISVNGTSQLIGKRAQGILLLLTNINGETSNWMENETRFMGVSESLLSHATRQHEPHTLFPFSTSPGRRGPT